MTQHPIEVILAKQLADHLASPVFIVDPGGTLLFYNEPAEVLLGLRFEETGSMPAETWGRLFDPVDEEGRALEPEELPLLMALRNGAPSHARFSIRSLDDVGRWIDVVAFPLEGHGGRHLGAMAVFEEERS